MKGDLSAKKSVKSIKMILSAFLILLICLQSLALNIKATTSNEVYIPDVTDYDASSYTSYISNYVNASMPEDTIILSAESATVVSKNKTELYTNYDGSDGKSLYTAESDRIEWNIEVKTPGLYLMKWEYYPIEGNGGNIKRRVLIDNELPFLQADNLSFCRLWKNDDGEIRTDTQGNQIMIEQVEAPAWMQQYATDSTGVVSGNLNFYLSSGLHKITIDCIMEPMLLKSITFCPVSQCIVRDYSETLKHSGGEDNVSESANIVLQGEDADFKSSQMIYPKSDKTSPSVYPYSATKTVYNTIGGSQWSVVGQWIEWKFYVEESGFYTLASHFKQSTKENCASVRKIYIDDKIPFTQAENWLFSYDSSWQTKYFSDENNNPYKFYLKKGEHTIRLEAGLGAYNDLINQSQELLNELNAIYRSIIVVSGVSPDQYRDYKFDETIPETIEKMSLMTDKLRKLEKQFQKVDNNNKTISSIKRVYDQLELMNADTDTITMRLSTFKSNIAAFGTWLNSLKDQPLMIDWISLSSPKHQLPDDGDGIFSMLSHYIKSFIYSFITDYQAIGQTEEASSDAVKVWLTTSRDQATILRNMVTNTFTPQSNIPVSVQLVSASSLMPSILTKKNPDIVLGVSQSDVNNLALRNAVYDISNISDCNEVITEFYEHSLDAFRWEGGLYALPQTEVYPMLFYRKDILKDLNISLDELSTWDSLIYSVFPKLQRNSLNFGLTQSIQNYLNFVYQSGGNLYIDNGKKSGLSSTEAIDSMKIFSALYEQYGLDLSFDFANRFRTGEMPIAVVDFTMYNTLTIFTGEITGLWGMLPIPGTKKSDGSIDCTAVPTLTGTVLLSNTENRDNAWEFMKWWSSAKTQAEFGRRIEAVVGSAARYNPANKIAAKQVAWNPEVRSAMIYQAENCRAYNEVAGGYFTTRYFDFAFRDIVYNDVDVRKAMEDMTIEIDREIDNKRKEYGLD